MKFPKLQDGNARPRRSTNQGAIPISILLLVMIGLSACETEEAKYERVDAQARHIMFVAPLLVDSKPAVFAKDGRRSQTELAMWRGAGASANFWYGSTLGLWRRDQEHMTEEMLRKWKELKDETLEIRKGGVVPSSLGAVEYWRFKKGGLQECFGVNHFWTPAPWDQGGYREWVNGYYCHPAGTPLSDKEITEMISRLEVREKVGDPGAGWQN